MRIELIGLAVMAAICALIGCGGDTAVNKTNAGKPTTTIEGDNASTTTADDAALEGDFEIDGSSTVYLISQLAVEEYSKAHPKVSISVKFAGTGGGFKRFVKGELAICDASRPIQEKEMADAKAASVEYIELPVAFDALTIAVNAKNDWIDSITVEDLKKMWQPESKIKTWADVNPKWPAEKISFHGAGKASGTYEYFTEAIVGKKGSCRPDVDASENDDQIIQGIEGDKYAIGYVPFAYYESRTDTLKALKIDWKSDDQQDAVAPSLEAVVSGTYNPLSRPLFIYVNRKNADEPAVKSFVQFYLANAKKLASEVKYIPLTDEAYSMGVERFTKLQIGTGYHGKSEFGLRIEEILKREPKS